MMALSQWWTFSPDHVQAPARVAALDAEMAAKSWVERLDNLYGAPLPSDEGLEVSVLSDEKYESLLADDPEWKNLDWAGLSLEPGCDRFHIQSEISVVYQASQII